MPKGQAEGRADFVALTLRRIVAEVWGEEPCSLEKLSKYGEAMLAIHMRLDAVLPEAALTVQGR